MIQGSRYWGLFLGLAIILAAGAGPAKEVPELNLPQLVGLALEYSPEIKATQSEVKVAKEQRAEVRGYYYPQFDAKMLGGLVPNARLPEIRNNAHYYLDPKDKIHGINVFGRLDFSLIQPLYAFGKLSFREQAAARNIRVKDAQVESKKGEVILRVAEAYYGLILAQQGLEAVKEARSYLSDTRNRLQRLLQMKSPSVRESDLYRLASYEGSLEKYAAEAEEGARVAYLALKALTGYPPGQDFRVPAEFPNPAAAPGRLDSYVQLAIELRPEFTMLKEGLAARELLVKAAKADRYPRLLPGRGGRPLRSPGPPHLAGPLRAGLLQRVLRRSRGGHEVAPGFRHHQRQDPPSPGRTGAVATPAAHRPDGHPRGSGPGLRQSPGTL